METGVLISLILGGAQIIGSVLVLWSTKINSDVSKLKDENERFISYVLLRSQFIKSWNLQTRDIGLVRLRRRYIVAWRII